MQSAQWSDLHFLMAEFRQGNTQAFKHIYGLQHRSLVVIAYKIVFDTAEAEDIVTESFIKLWEKRESMETLQHIKSWLVRVTTNMAIDNLKLSRRQELSEEEVLYLSDKEQEDDFLQAQIIKSELIDKTLALMNEMPESMRMIFKMIYVDRLETTEIARLLQLSPDTVRVQKARAIKLLKHAFHLNNPPEDPDG